MKFVSESLVPIHKYKQVSDDKLLNTTTEYISR